MNLSYYKTKLKAIDREMAEVMRQSTIEIDEMAKRLRELRADWASKYTAPTWNKLSVDRVQIQRLIAMERRKLDARKPTYSRKIHDWVQNYCRIHKGRYQVRAVGSKEEWLIVTNLPSHGRPTEHYALTALSPNKPVFTRQGRLTKAVLEQMVHVLEMSELPERFEGDGNTAAGDPALNSTIQQAPRNSDVSLAP